MPERLPLTLRIMFLVTVLPGCGASGMTYAPVSGKVTIDGKSLAGVAVTFIPESKPGSDVAGDTASALTDENGQYSLRTYTRDGWKDGAVVGKYKVSISKTETRGEGDRSVTTQKLPKRYNENTELTAEVTSGNNKKDFDLKSN